MSSSKRKKHNQLGMNPATASARLRKDLLYDFARRLDLLDCYHCGEHIKKDNFSTEHKKPWLDSEDPIELFFDLDNIAFSHLSCNVSAARRELAPCGTRSAYQRGCRCQDCSKAERDYRDFENDQRRENYCPEERRKRYLEKGY